MFDARNAGMESTEGVALALADARIAVRIEDLVANVSQIHAYRNDEDTNIEAVYTFPLPSEAVLLELIVRVGGRTLKGEIVAARDAEERYEEAIEEGNSAVMLQEVERGMYCANVGNVLPGETVQVEIHFALVLRLAGDQVRLALPTTIAPRYGVMRAEPNQVPAVSVVIENRFALDIRIAGLLAKAQFDCTTHQIKLQMVNDVAVLGLLAEQAPMDRDFVLSARLVGGSRSFALAGRDGDGVTVLASFQPIFAGLQADVPRNVKIVIDCSGSMAGDSIDQARKALMTILDALRPADRFNIVRFGSTAHALFPRQRAVTQRAITQARQLAEALDADLGGTEIDEALRVAFESRSDKNRPADVLLITDGEVNDWQPIVERARSSGHRLFTVGVGSAVAESFVRELAAATGGAAEFVTPNEIMAGRIVRQFERISAPRSRAARVLWPDGAQDAWPQDLVVFAGDTVLASARLAAMPHSPLAIEIEWEGGQAHRDEVAVREIAEESSEITSVARVAAGLRLPGLDPEIASGVALRYQLMSRWTHCIVVAERSASEKSAQLPELRVVANTLAAGWGAAGSVRWACMVSSNVSFLGLESDSLLSESSLSTPAATSQDARDVLAGVLNASPERITQRIISLLDLKPADLHAEVRRELEMLIEEGEDEFEVVIAFLYQLFCGSEANSAPNPTLLNDVARRALEEAHAKSACTDRIAARVQGALSAPGAKEIDMDEVSKRFDERRAEIMASSKWKKPFSWFTPPQQVEPGAPLGLTDTLPEWLSVSPTAPTPKDSEDSKS